MRGPISRVLKAAVATAMATAMLAAGCGGSSNNPPPDGGDDGGATFKVVLLQTNDIHSNLEGHDAVLDFTPATTGDDQTVGGISRLATRIAAERAAAGDTPVMLLDSGDFLMGTPFEFVMTPDAAELQEMQALNYDAITLGNHEFDWTPSGLFLVLTAARTHGVQRPDRRLEHEAGSVAGRQLRAAGQGDDRAQAGEDAAQRAQGRHLRSARQERRAGRADGGAVHVRSDRDHGGGDGLRAAQPGPRRPGHRAVALRASTRPARARTPTWPPACPAST